MNLAKLIERNKLYKAAQMWRDAMEKRQTHQDHYRETGELLSKKIPAPIENTEKQFVYNDALEPIVIFSQDMVKKLQNPIALP